MLLCEHFAVAVARIKRNGSGWIRNEDWESFFIHLQMSRDVKQFDEEATLIFSKRFNVVFTDNSVARFWQQIQIEPANDTTDAQVLYRVIVEVL